jgi:uncharacterized protein YceH (UPF0502 family)
MVYRNEVDLVLDSVQLRTLGALIEKESTTPEYYPLTLNALVAACNQKSNRWPVSDYEDRDLLTALSGLRAKGFAVEITGGSRVPKYAQRFTEKLNLGRRETAILCVLMLRGQQTLGEIKGRAERIYEFSDLDEVEMVLHKMMEREEGPLAQKLAPAPAMKEPRYAQTLTGIVEEGTAAAAAPAAASHGLGERIAALEAEVGQLRAEVAELRRTLESVL